MSMQSLVISFDKLCNPGQDYLGCKVIIADSIVSSSSLLKHRNISFVTRWHGVKIMGRLNVYIITVNSRFRKPAIV